MEEELKLGFGEVGFHVNEVMRNGKDNKIDVMEIP